MPIRTKWALAAVLLAASAARAQQTAAFAGTWRGEHKGKTYLLMSISTGSPMKISVATAHIVVGETGEIEEIDGPVENDEKVLESKLNGSTLSIKTEQADGSVVEYRMTLEDGGKSALLRVADAPDFIKPFRLRRA